MVERIITLDTDSVAQAVFGDFDKNIKHIAKLLSIDISARGTKLTLRGVKKDVEKSVLLITEFVQVIQNGGCLQLEDIDYAIHTLNDKAEIPLHDIYLDRVDVWSKKRPYVTPKTEGQKRYLDAIRQYDVTFAIGPAGTGKTYLAMAMAIEALRNGACDRIILTRPAVEAGENLGFLPGDLYEKVNPYLRPLYDALRDMMDGDRIKSLTESGVIEVAPLAFMRGRTLNDSFVILDEAQNCTPEQMKMLLTRLGFHSKVVITGDITQSDLPHGKLSGLEHAQHVLTGIDGIGFTHFSESDVVRHTLVQAIIRAYKNEHNLERGRKKVSDR